MSEVSWDRSKLEADVNAWASAPYSENKRTLGPPLLERMITVLSQTERQDLAKDQIGKAVKAMARDDWAAAGEHVKMALHNVAHAPVELSWDMLREDVRRLAECHPADDRD